MKFYYNQHSWHIESFLIQQELLAVFAVVICFHNSNWQIQNCIKIYINVCMPIYV